MSYRNLSFIVPCLIIVALTQNVLAWGERAHHAVGYTAAELTETFLTDEEKKKVGDFFSDRKIQMGHLNNIPDISWKEVKRKNVTPINGPHHYFDVDILLGAPKNGYDEKYLDQVRSLETDFDKIRAEFDGKPNPLPGATVKKIDIYGDVGTSPWRVQQLYDLMVEAFNCAEKVNHAKNKRAGAKRKDFRHPLRKSERPISQTYKCKKNSSRLENIYAASVFAGIMGHYIADMAQPYHCTKDFDSWTTGQGDIHQYFETDLVNGLEEDFLHDVSRIAKSKGDEKWRTISRGLKSNVAPFAVRIMMNLTADSLSELKTLNNADRKYAVVKLGDKLSWGAMPAKTAAQRKPATDPAVVKALKPIAVDRLATASVVLSRIWIAAWRAAGSPVLRDVNLIAVPYPLDVPFIWPSYISVKEMNKRISR